MIRCVLIPTKRHRGSTHDLFSLSIRRNRAGTSSVMMLIKGGFNLAFDCTDSTPMILTVHIRPEETSRLIEPEIFTVFPPVETSDYTDSFGNRCTKLVAPPGRPSICEPLCACGHDGTPEQLPCDAFQHAVQELPEETLMYLLGSRYCDTHKLSTEAWALFGKIGQGWPRVQAILDYTHHRIEFGYHMPAPTAPPRKAIRTEGVCRDFAHLAITLVPLHEYSGALLHRLSGRYRRAGGPGADGFQRLVRGFYSGRPLVVL